MSYKTSLLMVDHFISLDDGELVILLCDLGALVQVTDPPSTLLDSVKVWHASLEDFCFDPRRSKEFYIDKEATLTDILVCCLRILPRGLHIYHFCFVVSRLTFFPALHDYGIQELFTVKAGKSNISLELMEEVAKFPIGILFEPRPDEGFWISQENIRFVSALLRLSERAVSLMFILNICSSSCAGTSWEQMGA